MKLKNLQNGEVFEIAEDAEMLRALAVDGVIAYSDLLPYIVFHQPELIERWESDRLLPLQETRQALVDRIQELEDEIRRLKGRTCRLLAHKFGHCSELGQ
jgi:hypothetical protein